MWGHKKLKDWVRQNFIMKCDAAMTRGDYWELCGKVAALYDHLGLEVQHCPGKNIVVKKGGKGCQP